MEKEKLFSPYEIRMGIFYGAIVMGLLGILDPIMMPVHYRIAFIIRYAIFMPILIIFFILSFYEKFTKRSQIPSFLLLLSGQIVIIAFIAISSPDEIAYNSYYLGLFVILLWTAFVSRFGFKANLILFVITIVLLNLVFGFVDHSFSEARFSEELPRVVGINLLLMTGGLIIVNGSYRLEIGMEKTIKAKEAAEESLRLKSTFLSNMSHEIRTPLNGMIGFADILQEEDLAPYKRKLYLGFLQKGSHQLLKVINDIMDISKMESDQMVFSMEKLKAGKLIYEKVDFYRENIHLYTKRPIKIQVNLPPESINCFIHTDGYRFSQIMDNLISNALKYTNEGEVVVGISPLENKSQEYLQFYVKDTGIGIEQKNFEFIFEVFNKIEGKQLRPGNGLGLSISKKIVEKMGGRIWLESELDVGTTFFFTLPVVYNNNHTAIITKAESYKLQREKQYK
ncbi:MAG: ATP-binding protein [Prolixibacteraceae bacterium]